MYKNKDKQREAVKLATRRYRERKQGITHKVSQVSHNKGITDRVSQDVMVIPPTPQLTPEPQDRIRPNKRTVVEPQSHNPMMVGYVPLVE
jgi:hypothetical protein